jgi:hypothetical protein
LLNSVGNATILLQCRLWLVARSDAAATSFAHQTKHYLAHSNPTPTLAHTTITQFTIPTHPPRREDKFSSSPARRRAATRACCLSSCAYRQTTYDHLVPIIPNLLVKSNKTDSYCLFSMLAYTVA